MICNQTICFNFENLKILICKMTDHCQYHLLRFQSDLYIEQLTFAL